MKARRPVAFLVACWFAFLSAWMPRQAFAFVPVVIAGAPQILTVGGSTVSMAALTGLVGLVGLYMTIEDAQQNSLRIPLGPNSQNQPPSPAAAPTTAASQTGGGSPVAPTSVNNYCSTHSASGAWMNCGVTYMGEPTPEGACAAAGYSGYNTYTGKCTGQIGSLGTVSVQNCPAGYTLNGGICQPPPIVYTCPQGYSVSGSSCMLTNANLATDDKTCDLLVSMGQFATADDMNCSSTADGSRISPILRNGRAIAYGRNSEGQPLMWEVRPSTPVWPYYTVYQYEQVQTATQTQVKTTEIQVDAQTSQITSVTTSTSPGQIAPPTAQTVPTQTDPQTEPTTQENTPTVQTRNGEPLMPQFPDDYAREPTLKEIRDALTQQSEAPDAPASRTASEISESFFNGTFDALKGWSMPGHSSQCPTGSFSALGSTFVIDSHCTLISNHWGVLQAAMIVVWSIAALWIVLRA